MKTENNGDNGMNEISQYFLEITAALKSQDDGLWDEAGKLLLNAYNNNKCVWIAGNGGNLTNSLHFATDWSKGIFLETKKSLRVRCLSENIALTSAFSNDLGFDNQFAEQLKMLAAPSDVAVLLSAGGKSQNILIAAKEAKKLDLKIIGLTGGSGLESQGLFDVHINISSFNIQVVEDVHAIFGHAMLKYLLQKLTP
jgi:D-sedoheptulose 7-phosphate isomerase